MNHQFGGDRERRQQLGMEMFHCGITILGMALALLEPHRLTEIDEFLIEEKERLSSDPRTLLNTADRAKDVLQRQIDQIDQLRRKSLRKEGS